MSKALRCAIYTRKSSDEGLEQSFNSLDAQREAGEAYVLSQAHEGWKLLPARYDDGGFSGGTMARPGLRNLLDDVEAGLVGVVVVYKIDRLTRSLADFARIVELFDKHEVSFVSVTQAFNTTSSMGRLTLNVLLSFAQFEREVTGERIRDKIAASKRKGMWMGGYPPLGYDTPDPSTRILRVNEIEAKKVRYIYSRYLELRSVHSLQRELEAASILSKVHVTQKDRTLGGKHFSRGALFHLLRNQIYQGKIVHKGQVYEGAHLAIIDPAIFQSVQSQLDDQARRHRKSAERRVITSPLKGRIVDEDGSPMTPSFSQGRGGRIYRYYVSSTHQTAAKSTTGMTRRIRAADVERVIGDAIGRWLPHERFPFEQLRVARRVQNGFEIELCGTRKAAIAGRLSDGELVLWEDKDACCVLRPLILPLRGGKRLILDESPALAQPDRPLIKALKRAHTILAKDRRGLPTILSAPVSPYERKLLRLAFLEPAIQRDIVEGRQPSALNLEQLMRTDIPLGWQEQRQALGWPAAD